MTDAECRAAELEALTPVYAIFGDVSVHATLDQWWAVRVSGYGVEGDNNRVIESVGQAHSFLGALRYAAAKVVEMAGGVSTAVGL